MKPLLSIGLQSDILVMRGLSILEDHADRIVMRTPSEPDYWSGNCIILRHGPEDPAADLARFRADFPDSAHVYLFWDAPGADADAAARACTPLGLKVEDHDVLLLSGPVVPVPLPDGIIARPLGPEDWSHAVDLYHAVDMDEGYPDNAAHRGYVERRFAARARQVADGQGAWFGAFDGARMVAGMGLFHDARLGRFQHVVTAPSHRGRGICAGLLSHVAGWARGRVPGLPLVIIADPAGAAGRIYRRAGFVRQETFLAAMARGY